MDAYPDKVPRGPQSFSNCRYSRQASLDEAHMSMQLTPRRASTTLLICFADHRLLVRSGSIASITSSTLDAWAFKGQQPRLFLIISRGDGFSYIIVLYFATLAILAGVICAAIFTVTKLAHYMYRVKSMSSSRTRGLATLICQFTGSFFIKGLAIKRTSWSDHISLFSRPPILEYSTCTDFGRSSTHSGSLIS